MTGFGIGFESESGKLHLEKRKMNGDYLHLNVEEYNNLALDLLCSDVGGDIKGYETKSGKVVRWNTVTNDYATGIRHAKVKTLFPLTGGESRFNALRERDEREGGGLNE